MLDALLIILAAYLGATYLLGAYLALRVLLGRRLRHALAGARAHQPVRPIARATPTVSDPGLADDQPLPDAQRLAA